MTGVQTCALPISMKAGTPQIHAHITPNTVWAAGDPIAVIKDDPRADITSEVCGFTDYVGTPAPPLALSTPSLMAIRRTPR